MNILKGVGMLDKDNFKDFKDGVADALLKGNMRDSNRSAYYKQGYDFGLSLYCLSEGDNNDG